MGSVLRVDTHTATEAKGRYARICVQVDVSKPLITSVRIGHRNQPVTYEGVSKLCFSCGRLGHRKETCQFTIRSPSPPPKDAKELNDTEVACQTPATPKERTEVQNEDQSALDSVGSDASFGPWMVVSRKRNNNNLAKRNSSNTLLGNGKYLHQEKTFVLLESSGGKMDWAGPSKAKEEHGKRKGQLSSPSASLSPLVDQSPTFSCGLGSSGPNQKNVKSVGRSVKEMSKPKTGSVKGKKEIARNGVSAAAASTTLDKATFNVAVSDKPRFSTPSDWSSCISNIRSEMNSEFKFGAKPDSNVGDHRDRSSCGDTVWAENRSLNTKLNHGSILSMDVLSSDHGHGSTSIDRGGLGTIGRSVVGNRSRHSSDENGDCEAEAGQRPDERNGEEDRMESDGGSDFPTSN